VLHHRKVQPTNPSKPGQASLKSQKSVVRKEVVAIHNGASATRVGQVSKPATAKGQAESVSHIITEGRDNTPSRHITLAQCQPTTTRRTPTIVSESQSCHFPLAPCLPMNSHLHACLRQPRTTTTRSLSDLRDHQPIKFKFSVNTTQQSANTSHNKRQYESY
jgi:hypothetical protein